MSSPGAPAWGPQASLDKGWRRASSEPQVKTYCRPNLIRIPSTDCIKTRTLNMRLFLLVAGNLASDGPELVLLPRAHCPARSGSLLLQDTNRLLPNLQITVSYNKAWPELRADLKLIILSVTSCFSEVNLFLSPPFGFLAKNNLRTKASIKLV